MIGKSLGNYLITAKLGEGGMGEVYRARDSKLDRDVAIKVLPGNLATDAEALARFEREAKAVAALSHPNILAIFDFGRDGDVVFAAMELLEGETLTARLAAGALPARKALEIAAQAARGLAAAHERGIVHRDLKPDNLYVTADGQVKILDFGLARQLDLHDSKSQLLAAPTQGPGTAPGAVLGTVGYMSPEQVRGELADHRSDIFSLGVVLYEMLTGKRAFARDSSVETMTAILREEPHELENLGEKLSPSVARLVQHCLEKRPAERFQSARDLAFDLTSLATGVSASERSGRALPEAGASARRRRLLPLLLLAAGAILGGAVVAVLDRGRSPVPTATAALRPSFRQLTKTPGAERAPAISPDGESFVFVKPDGEDLDLFSQRVDGTKAIALTADCDQDDYTPAFSPDGRSIAFRSECGGGGIFVMGATGESMRRVADFGYLPAWSPDGRELAVVTERPGSPTGRNSTSLLWAVRVDSGERRKVSDHDAMAPTWSPDGRRIAFWGLKRDTFQRDLWSVAADGSESAESAATPFLDDAPVDWAPVYSHDGRWLYFASTRGGTFNLWRLALDAKSGQPRGGGGEPEPVTAPSSWAGPMALSNDGRRLLFVDRNVETSILRAPLDAARGELAASPQVAFSGSFELREQAQSPDGEWLLFTNEDPPQQLHLVHPDGTGYRQLTNDQERNRQGNWSPKGDWIVFQTTRGDSSLAAIRPDGGGWQSLGAGPGHATPTWSPDGATIASFDNNRGAFLHDVRGGLNALQSRLLPPIEEGVLFWPLAWSPDGSLLAGRAHRAGQSEDVIIYTVATGAYRRPSGVEASDSDLSDLAMAFVDRQRLVTLGHRDLWLRDLGGREPRRLYAAPPGHRFSSLSASRDGRWLTWLDIVDESDIWLATLDEPGEVKGAEAGAKP